jgi:hypothetical protein
MGIQNSLNKIVKKINGTERKNNKIVENPPNDDFISLCFSINRDGQLFIDGKWVNNSIEISKALASFIYIMFSGGLYSNIINYFNTVATINEEYFEFSKNTLLFIQDYLEKENEIDETPIIKPSQAFRFGNEQSINNVNNDELDEEDEQEIAN